MSTILLDQFTRPDSGSSIGGSWLAPAAGTWGIFTNRGVCAVEAGASAYSAVAIESGVSDCIVEVTVTFPASGFAGLWLRGGATTATGFYMQSDKLFNSSPNVSLGTFSSTFVSGDRARAQLEGDRIIIYRRVAALGLWTEVLDIESTLWQTNTRHGLNIWGAGTLARFDDFKISTVEYLTNATVEIAFDSGYATPAASRTWTDVSEYVAAESLIGINHGRPDEFSNVEPNKLTLTLENLDGRFTAGNVSSPYYPNVKIGRPIRVKVNLAGNEFIRFNGYIDEWPTAWPEKTDNRATAQITASSRMARLGLDLPLRPLVSEVILESDPIGYWTLGESAGSREAMEEISGMKLTPTVSAGPPTFGGELNLKADSTTGATFSAATNAHLRGELPQSVDNDARDLLVECFHFGPLDAFAGGAYLFRLTADPEWAGATGIYEMRCGVDPSFSIYLALYLEDGTEIAKCWTATQVDLTQPRHIQARLHPDGVNSVITLSVATAETLTNPGGIEQWSDNTPSAGFPAVFDLIRVGFNTNDTLGHVAVFNEVYDSAAVDRWIERFLAGLVGTPEYASERLARYARYASVPVAETDFDALSTEWVGSLDINNALALEAMRRVEATEGGVLYDSVDNILTYRERAARYNAPTAFTINAALQELEHEVTPKLDRSSLINEVTATGVEGVTATVSDATSIEEYGIVRGSLELLAETNDQAFQAASWQLALYKQPKPRIPNVGIDFLALDLVTQQAVLGAGIGSVLALTGLPVQAPSSSLEQFIEGWTETIGYVSHEFTFNVSPATGYDVWTLEDPQLGEYDSNPLAY